RDLRLDIFFGKRKKLCAKSISLEPWFLSRFEMIESDVLDDVVEPFRVYVRTDLSEVGCIDNPEWTVAPFHSKWALSLASEYHAWAWLESFVVPPAPAIRAIHRNATGSALAFNERSTVEKIGKVTDFPRRKYNALPVEASCWDATWRKISTHRSTSS